MGLEHRLADCAGSSRPGVDVVVYFSLFPTAHFTGEDHGAGRRERHSRGRASCKLLILCSCHQIQLPLVACVLLPDVVLEFPAEGKRISFWMIFKWVRHGASLSIAIVEDKPSGPLGFQDTTE